MGGEIMPFWDFGGSVLWLCVEKEENILRYCRSYEIFAEGSGVVYPVHCLTRSDAALFPGNNLSRRLQCSGADHIELRFCADNVNQVQVGSSVAGTRSEVRGSCFELELGGGSGAVAPAVALLLCHAALPKHAPLTSYRSRGQARAWLYGQALRAPR